MASQGPAALLRALRASPLKARFRQIPKQQARFQSTAAHNEGSTLSRFFNSPVGPKTVHFWAPVMKWGLVLTGVSDFARPAESLSITQNLALMATGAIWTRWCFVIRPQNYFLAAVNFFLFCVGTTQVTRVLNYQSQQKGTTLAAEVQNIASEQAKNVVGMAKNPEKVVEKAAKS